MQELLECYESTLMANLDLKPHALSLLQMLKAHDKKIAIITEGPQDAQERTIVALSIAPYVDYLATTNKLGVSKVDGMFTCVLEVLGVRADEVVMVGDSRERDMVPAMNVGLACVWFDEKNTGENTACDGAVRVGSLAEIESMLAEV
jgi:putative hydrolase of the HAD superfamily